MSRVDVGVMGGPRVCTTSALIHDFSRWSSVLDHGREGVKGAGGFAPKKILAIAVASMKAIRGSFESVRQNTIDAVLTFM